MSTRKVDPQLGAWSERSSPHNKYENPAEGLAVTVRRCGDSRAILEKLAFAETRFFRAADSKPRTYKWSAAEIELAALGAISPIPLEASMPGDKDEMLGKLRHARERTLVSVRNTETRPERTLLGSRIYWDAECLGMVERIAAHQIRHAKQIKAGGNGTTKTCNKC